MSASPRPVGEPPASANGLAHRAGPRRGGDSQGAGSPEPRRRGDRGARPRTPATLVEAVPDAPADVGSIPTVSIPRLSPDSPPKRVRGLHSLALAADIGQHRAPSGQRPRAKSKVGRFAGARHAGIDAAVPGRYQDRGAGWYHDLRPPPAVLPFGASMTQAQEPPITDEELRDTAARLGRFTSRTLAEALDTDVPYGGLLCRRLVRDGLAYPLRTEHRGDTRATAAALVPVASEARMFHARSGEPLRRSLRAARRRASRERWMRSHRRQRRSRRRIPSGRGSCPGSRSLGENNNSESWVYEFLFRPILIAVESPAG